MVLVLKVKKQNRDKRLPETRVTSAELLSVKKKAKCAGLSFSEFHRRALNDANIVVRNDNNIADAKLLSELSAVANNLNQLVRNEHIHNKADSKQMRNILSAIDMIIIGLVDDPENK